MVIGAVGAAVGAVPGVQLPLQVHQLGVLGILVESFLKCFLGQTLLEVHPLAVVVYIFRQILLPVFPTLSSGRQGGVVRGLCFGADAVGGGATSLCTVAGSLKHGPGPGSLKHGPGP